MKFTNFRKKFLAGVVLPMMILSFSGCVYMIVGGLGALGGYVASPDTVEGVTSRDNAEVWDAAIEIVSIMGLIEERSDSAGQLVGRVNGAKVTIDVMTISPTTTKIRVKARKAFFPKIHTAQQIYIKIMTMLTE